MLFDAYWVDGWDEARQEPVGSAVKLTRESLATALQAAAYGLRCGVWAPGRYWPGHVVVLDGRGRRHHPRLELLTLLN